MPNESSASRSTVACILVSILVCLTGCPAVSPPNPEPSPTDRSAKLPPTPELLASVAETLRFNVEHRQVSVPPHGGWQVMHGILAYGQAFPIRVSGSDVDAVQYLLGGGRLPGFELRAGDQFGSPVGIGIRVDLQPDTKIGQGHRDQWLAVLAQAGLEAQQSIPVGTEALRIEDWVRQVEYDIPLNFESEFSWTLIALTSYRPTTHVWQARDGNHYSIESLLASELAQTLETSACGGTHRLIGIATALNRRKQEGGAISGVWAEAESLVKAAIALAKQNQNPDGSYSADYFHRVGWTPDLAESLGTTGHVLEFLAIAAADDVLAEPWVDRTANRLVEILDTCRSIDLECGVLYHALHGLQEWHHRRVGDTAVK